MGTAVSARGKKMLRAGSVACDRGSGDGSVSKKDLATHSSILAWEIPWAEGPGRLQSVGSQRVRYN